MNSLSMPVTLNAEVTLELPLNGVKLIEASAGTGKTYTITNLYLRHIFEGRSPAEILVVTFTNAATEELRGRIRSRIHDTLQLFSRPVPCEDDFLALLLMQRQTLDRDQQKRQLRQLQLALRSMDEAAIFTIHGFCQRALTEHSLSSGQAFDATLLNDDLSLWEDALKDWWRQQSYSLNQTDWHLFQSCLGGLSTLLKTQSDLRDGHQSRILPEIAETLTDQFEAWRLLDTELESLATGWRHCKDEIFDVLQHSKALSRQKKLPYHQDNLPGYFDIWDRYFESDQLLIIPESLYYLGSSSLVANSTKAKRGTDPELESDFFELAQQLLDKIDRVKNRFRVCALTEASRFAHERVGSIKRETRSMAFQDQLSLLYEALMGPSAQALGEQLRSRFPVAMIDEFQDTDAIQFGIFKKIYFDQENISLTMIGDPKQAIYSFRGGDIYTYIKAKKEALVNHYSLLTNWRSEARLVEAVNHIFKHRAAPFVYAESIAYLAVDPASKKPAAPLLIDDVAVKPLTIWSIPLNQQRKNLSKNQAYELVNRATVNEISRLLEGGRQGLVRLGEKPLVRGDIAILVRTGMEGSNLRTALADRNIRAVTIGRDKVFDSEEAQGLYALLLAVNHFSDRRLLRASLASSLLNLDYRQIAEISENETGWQNWCENIRDLHLVWLKKGFIAMFQQLLQQLQIGESLAEASNAERSLTNLLHLAELCQQHSQVSAGLDALLAWYRKQMEDTAAEETELRLESDEDLVKIVTIHKSKGLEYPVVFIPFLWTCRPADIKPGATLKFHDSQYNPVIDLGSDDHAEHNFITEKERLAEDIRLAYVAITRARARVYLAWGDVGDGKMSGRPAKTALGYLLHAQQAPQDLESSLPWAFDNADNIAKELDILASSSEETIEVKPLPVIDEDNLPEICRQPESSLQPASFSVILANNWRINSFSGLTRDIHQTAHGGRSGRGEDAILDFPAGSHVGLLLHSVLERLDFQLPVESQCAELLPRLAPRFDLDSYEYQITLSQWMASLMRCPLNDTGLMLSSLSMAQRLNELAFDFAFDEFKVDRLNSFLQGLADQHLPPLELDNFRGMITGIIDLVFEHEGKYYLADYKSNFLGASLDDYTPDKLQISIYDRRYDLQYLLYSVALHRYLAQRVPGYRYELHFGGVYYLFIRAMRPQHGRQYGVFFDLPDYNRVVELDSLMATTTPISAA
jgi:exodeoxyribonuclease V beta subunit